MPKGIRVERDIEVMIEMVIRERRIALPQHRLVWYAKWFHIPCTKTNVQRVIRKMVKEGKLLEVRDGSRAYYKNRR